MGIDYGFYTFVTSCVILLVQLHLVSKSAGWLSISSEFVPGPDYNEKVAHVPEMSISGRHVKKVVERNGMLVYEDGDIPHPSYVNVAPLTEKQAELDIMAELSKLRIAANTQKEVLIAANRMPPETAVSRMIADRTRAYMLEDELGTSLLPGCSSISELPLYLSRQYPNGIGVILGVGKGSFVLSLLKGWVTMGGLYLVDPYIHIYKGYDNEGNVDDRTHQLIYENLRNDIVKIGTSQNKYAFIRDFSFEFAKTFEKSGQQNQLVFVWLDANPSYITVMKDIRDWWSLLPVGGMIGGTTYSGETKKGVDELVAKLNQKLVVLQHEWIIVKS